MTCALSMPFSDTLHGTAPVRCKSGYQSDDSSLTVGKNLQLQSDGRNAATTVESPR
jgi:hypothetical protein